MTALRSLAYTGVEFAKSPAERRSILLSNCISLIVVALSLVLFGVYYRWYGWSVITAAIPSIGLLSVSTVLLNNYGFSVISRIWICVFIPVMTTILSIYSKIIYYDTQEELDYFTFRFIILSSCVFPAIFFSIREKVLLFGTMALSFAILILHDPLHEAFGVGYRSLGMMETNYAFTNIVIGMTYFITVSAVFFLKWVSEKNELKAESLIRELNQINEELVEKNIEIESQNLEITAQSENLNINQRRLQDAYKLIEEQKNLLYRQNKNLSSALVDKNKNLSETNTELIKHNNELRQFSYTVSHNLRGPVASLLGLVNLIDRESLSKEDREILHHIFTSANQLDGIIRDLGKIIDIRHDIFKIRQKIGLQSVLKEIMHMVKKDGDQPSAEIITDFECPDIYSVKPLVQSILYNLISNALKYRSPERRPVIHIASRETDTHYVICVKDNGIGIDLQQHKENLFKLYKRFHFHTEGKGLGLYLVKLQAETLGGTIGVESTLNKETEFTVTLAKPENTDRQVLYEEPFARIFFDANVNATGVIWNGPVSSEQYRLVFRKCLEFVKAYNTPNYIADISHQGPIDQPDLSWMLAEIMPEAVHAGLKRIAGVRPDAKDPGVQHYIDSIKKVVERMNIRQEFFTSMDEASNWIREANEVATLKANV